MSQFRETGRSNCRTEHRTNGKNQKGKEGSNGSNGTSRKDLLMPSSVIRIQTTSTPQSKYSRKEAIEAAKKLNKLLADKKIHLSPKDYAQRKTLGTLHKDFPRLNEETVDLISVLLDYTGSKLSESHPARLQSLVFEVTGLSTPQFY